MIVSHKYKFIYIRCIKTASTSTELALSRICGPDDVITSIDSPQDEALRRQIGGRGPQHNLNRDGTIRFYGHMSAAGIRSLINEDAWASYYKWCVERDPYDKVISYYDYYYRDTDDRPPLLEFLESHGAIMRAVNFYRYTINEKVVVDRILRYEHLATELEQMAAQLGLPAEATMLPRAKAQFRRDRRHYSTLYTPAERDLVAKLFAHEITLHGYQYRTGADR